MVSADAERDIRLHLERGDRAAAATVAIRTYGPAILAYLRSMLRDEAVAADVFSEFSEHLWKGIGSWRSESSFGTWAYRVAWGAVRRFSGDAYRKRRRPLESSAASRLAAEVHQSTALHLRTAVKDKVAALRENLAPEERTLLVLRIDRKLPWTEVAAIMSEDDAPLDEAVLRKRFERLKNKLRRLAAAAGILPG